MQNSTFYGTTEMGIQTCLASIRISVSPGWTSLSVGWGGFIALMKRRMSGGAEISNHEESEENQLRQVGNSEADWVEFEEFT